MASKTSNVREAHGGVDAWNELYEYVEHEIMKYDDDMKLPRKFMLRLEGLSKGNFIANKNIEPMAIYQYQDILLAFKLAKVLMTHKTDFEDDEHRFNYAMVLVEKKINDIVKAKKTKEKVTSKVHDIDIGNQINEKAEYKSRAEQIKTNEVLDGLW